VRRAAILLVALAGCGGPAAAPGLVWGKKGVLPGDLARPRAAAIDPAGRLWLVDFTARVQAFDLGGHYLGPTFTTPDYRNGRPSGLGVTRDGRLIVADSHYSCLRVYDADGTERQMIAGGDGAGYFSDAVQDENGYFYVSEFGPSDRVRKYDADGGLVGTWGETGDGPGQLNRPRALALGPDGLLYVADACNHRIQAFRRDGSPAKCWGGPGDAPGQFRYPYDLAFGPDGMLFVVEYGNGRVQRLTADGQPRGTWGGPGRAPGKLASPWALAVDARGRVHVIDTENHRVQRIDW
jgi:DNA-binding beta-propeller fold protein YncE